MNPPTFFERIYLKFLRFFGYRIDIIYLDMGMRIINKLSITKKIKGIKLATIRVKTKKRGSD